VFAPVLPDVAVDATGAEGWASAVARGAAVAAVLALCAGAYALQTWRYRRLARLAPPPITGVDRRATLVLPMSPRPAYRREARRTGDIWEVAELLMEAVRPTASCSYAPTPSTTPTSTRRERGWPRTGCSTWRSSSSATPTTPRRC
jgi:hypothetical protein